MKNNIYKKMIKIPMIISLVLYYICLCMQLYTQKVIPIEAEKLNTFLHIQFIIELLSAVIIPFCLAAIVLGITKLMNSGKS